MTIDNDELLTSGEIEELKALQLRMAEGDPCAEIRAVQMCGSTPQGIACLILAYHDQLGDLTNDQG